MNLPGILTSDILFSQLLMNGNKVTAHLSNGTQISGQLLGWDKGYLLLVNSNDLLMIVAERVVWLQTNLSEMGENTPIQVPPQPPQPEFTERSTNYNDYSGQSFPNFKSKPAFIEEPAQPAHYQESNPVAKARLEQLVRNW